MRAAVDLVTSYTHTQRNTTTLIDDVQSGNVDAMTKPRMSVEEYLRTSFDGADREYLDGEVVERNMCELPHATVQGELIALLRALRQAVGIRVFPELRVQVTPTRFRVPDVAVWTHEADIGTRIPKVPPFLAIEVMSPEDRFRRIETKIREYLAFGVEWVWILDPSDRSASIYSHTNPAGTAVDDLLRTENPTIEIPLADVFADLPPADSEDDE
jgi:Uma2 family endonuclease